MYDTRLDGIIYASASQRTYFRSFRHNGWSLYYYSCYKSPYRLSINCSVISSTSSSSFRYPFLILFTCLHLVVNSFLLMELAFSYVFETCLMLQLTLLAAIKFYTKRASLQQSFSISSHIFFFMNVYT